MEFLIYTKVFMFNYEKMHIFVKYLFKNNINNVMMGPKSLETCFTTS